MGLLPRLGRLLAVLLLGVLKSLPARLLEAAVPGVAGVSVFGVLGVDGDESLLEILFSHANR